MDEQRSDSGQGDDLDHLVEWTVKHPEVWSSDDEDEPRTRARQQLIDQMRPSLDC